jgi:hypothetical protein
VSQRILIQSLVLVGVGLLIARPLARQLYRSLTKGD